MSAGTIVIIPISIYSKVIFIRLATISAGIIFIISISIYTKVIFIRPASISAGINSRHSDFHLAFAETEVGMMKIMLG